MVSRKPLIAVDLDGVLNNLNEVWLNRYNKDYNDNLTLNDWKSWDISKLVKPECGYKFLGYLREPGFFSSKSLSPIPFAQEVTQRLLRYYDIKVVTAYIPEACYDKCEFINTYYPWIGSDNVVFCNDKSIINAEWLIDDGPHNHDTFRGRGIVFDYEYSKNTHPELYHVTSWIQTDKILLGSKYSFKLVLV